MKQLGALAVFLLAIFTNQAFGDNPTPSRQIAFRIINSNISEKTEIDIAAFEKKFTISKIKTESPYENGVFEFEGVRLKEMIVSLKLKSYSKMIIKAVDGYKVEWTSDEINEFDPMLAFKKNGNYLKTKDKGTFRIVMDYRSNKPKDEKKYTPKWIWQINEIEILD